MIGSRGAREYAEQLVLAWLRADYEPDDVDETWMSERSAERLINRIADLISGQRLWVSRAPRSRLGAHEIKIGTPREMSHDARGERNVRATDCPAYTLCLDYALERGWDGWSCRECDGPNVEARRKEKRAQGKR